MHLALLALAVCVPLAQIAALLITIFLPMLYAPIHPFRWFERERITAVAGLATSAGLLAPTC